MSNNNHRPSSPFHAAAAAATSAPSFAEAQHRLAARRRERAAAETTARAQAAAAADAQRAAAAAARHARLAAVAPIPVARAFGETALAAWDGASQITSVVGRRWQGNTDGFESSSEGPARRFPAFRVSQVDAELLDEELLGLLRGQVTDALRYLRGGALVDDWAPEVMLVLRAALFKLSMWDHDATYGAALQNLRYADARRPKAPFPRSNGGGSGGHSYADAAVDVPRSLARWQKAIYGLVAVGGRYAWSKWEDWLRDHDDGSYGDGETAYTEVDGTPEATAGSDRLSLSPRLVRRLGRASAVASDLYAGAAFMSFLVFLRYGRYRTLLDRVLRMRLVPPTSQVSREVSFEYLNRQLVWHAFTEFLLFVLPLVGLRRWRRWVARTWRKTKSAVATVAGRAKSGEGDDGDFAEAKSGEFAFLPERTCAICYQDQNSAMSEADLLAAAAASSGVIGSAETDITNPYEARPCGCMYCYVCLATRIEREEGDGWTCLRCRALVTSCRPWNGDVLEPAAVLASTTATPADNSGATGRPLSSSSSSPATSARSSATASGSPLHSQKSVGFADDVKGDEDEEEVGEAEHTSSFDNFPLSRDDEQNDREAAASVSSDSDAEGYEEEEEGMNEDVVE
ncbi:Pex [Niveomyces insectorum RCEF 264]|uniref:Pex n=1 Tax=Niveomyces insectorum RCEF 264 TaxID=1081102 RepID=A0A162ICN1_9HYPO|nr:Pex [Niveomyces insectorum RCEF 264]